MFTIADFDHMDDCVAHILATSFDMFAELTDLDENELAEIIKETLLSSFDGSRQKIFIASVNDEPAGAIWLEFNGNSRTRYPFWKLSGRYGFINTTRFLIGLRSMHVIEKEENCYMAKLAVKKECRGKGVASALVERAIGFAKENKFENLTLYVSSDNPNAIRLYEKHGFAEIRRVRTFIEKIMFRIPGWIYMKRVI